MSKELISQEPRDVPIEAREAIDVILLED